MNTFIDHGWQWELHHACRTAFYLIVVPAWMNARGLWGETLRILTICPVGKLSKNCACPASWFTCKPVEKVWVVMDMMCLGQKMRLHNEQVADKFTCTCPMQQGKPCHTLPQHTWWKILEFRLKWQHLVRDYPGHKGWTYLCCSQLWWLDLPKWFPVIRIGLSYINPEFFTTDVVWNLGLT